MATFEELNKLDSYGRRVVLQIETRITHEEKRLERLRSDRTKLCNNPAADPLKLGDRLDVIEGRERDMLEVICTFQALRKIILKRCAYFR